MFCSFRHPKIKYLCQACAVDGLTHTQVSQTFYDSHVYTCAHGSQTESNLSTAAVIPTHNINQLLVVALRCKIGLLFK